MPSLEERQAIMRERLERREGNLPFKVEVVYPKRDPYEPKSLNEREKQVLCGMFQGYEDDEISLRLNTTVQTIKNVRHSAYRKLGIKSIRGLFPLVIAGGMELRTGSNATQ